jgi:predicted AAA+ superfamily ATPase
LVDQPDAKRKFLILGSASRDLIRQSSETLSGRIAYIELTPFSMDEVDDSAKLWLRGGFPKSYLAKSIDESIYWRKQYIATFLERDIPSFGIRIPPLTLRRFWIMLAHYHGQSFNASEIGKSLGVSDTTARHYLDILTGSFMMRQLPPWIANVKKRQVKTPKIYFRDSGIYHSLSGVTDHHSLMHYPKLGASWEGFALEEIAHHYQADPEECFFWGVHNQAELDLLIVKNGKYMGFEFKYGDSPRLTPSMEIALETLELDSLHVIYPGKKDYSLGKNISVRCLDSICKRRE